MNYRSPPVGARLPSMGTWSAGDFNVTRENGSKLEEVPAETSNDCFRRKRSLNRLHLANFERLLTAKSGRQILDEVARSVLLTDVSPADKDQVCRAVSAVQPQGCGNAP